jgi:hypothetical protein
MPATENSDAIQDQLAAKRPVWIALAELYLDTEHTARDLERIAEVLARSPFSVSQLREIELWEVAPVVGCNLRRPAGVWAGFDADWLVRACAERAQRRPGFLRAAIRRGMRRLAARATASEWRRLALLTAAWRAYPRMR